MNETDRRAYLAQAYARAVDKQQYNGGEEGEEKNLLFVFHNDGEPEKMGHEKV